MQTEEMIPRKMKINSRMILMMDGFPFFFKSFKDLPDGALSHNILEFTIENGKFNSAELALKPKHQCVFHKAHGVIHTVKIIDIVSGLYGIMRKIN